MAIIIGILMAVIILLAFAILLIITRHRQRKCFASPLTTKSALAENHQHLSAESSCGTYSGKDGTSSSSGLTHPLQKGASSHIVNRLIKIDDYQEPYQALRYAPYYSYSSVVMEMRDTLNKANAGGGMHVGEYGKNGDSHFCVGHYGLFARFTNAFSLLHVQIRRTITRSRKQVRCHY